MNVSDFEFLQNVKQNFKLTVKQCSPLSYTFCVRSLIGSTLSDKSFLSHFGIQGHNSTYELPQAKMVRPAHPRSLIRAFAAQTHHIRPRNNKKGYDTECTASISPIRRPDIDWNSVSNPKKSANQLLQSISCIHKCCISGNFTYKP